MDSRGLRIDSYDEDEPLIRAVVDDGRPRLRIYRPSTSAVVLGRGSDAARELYLEHCRTDRVPLFRRRGGGCSVFIDPGNVILSVVLPAAGINHTRPYFDLLTDWLLAGLQNAGYPGVRRDGISDLTLNDRKISGSSVYRSKGLLHYSTTLLVAPDFDKIGRYLQHPPREPEYRQGRAHREFLTDLTSAGTAEDAERIATELRGALMLKDLPWTDIDSPNISQASTAVIAARI